MRNHLRTSAHNPSEPHSSQPHLLLPISKTHRSLTANIQQHPLYCTLLLPCQPRPVPAPWGSAAALVRPPSGGHAGDEVPQLAAQVAGAAEGHACKLAGRTGGGQPTRRYSHMYGHCTTAHVGTRCRIFTYVGCRINRQPELVAVLTACPHMSSTHDLAGQMMQLTALLMHPRSSHSSCASTTHECGGLTVLSGQ